MSLPYVYAPFSAGTTILLWFAFFDSALSNQYPLLLKITNDDFYCKELPV